MRSNNTASNETKIHKAAVQHYVLPGILVIILVIIIVWFLTQNNTVTEEPRIESTSKDPIVVYEEVEKRVEVEKVFTNELIMERLNDIGVLLTEEYSFTDVVSYSSTKSIEMFGKNLNLPFSETSFLFSYDGVVNAGLNFSEIIVNIIEPENKIEVCIPKAKIQSVVIDYESFNLYDEHTGIFNPVSIEDYNQSLIELQKKVRQKAIDKGILEKADNNAKLLIENLIGSFVDVSTYSISFIVSN